MSKKEGPPALSPDDLAQAIRDYLADEGKRPDTERLARRLGCTVMEVREAFSQLIRAGRARFDSGFMTLIDGGAEVKPDTTPAAATVKVPPPTPHVPVLTRKPTTTAPASATALKEVQETMPKWPTYEADKALMDEYNALRDRTDNCLQAISEKYGVPKATMRSRIEAAERRLKAHASGNSTYRPNPPTGATEFQCEQCKDSGVTKRTDQYVTYCTCPIGARLERQEQGGTVASIPSASLAPAAQAVTEDQGQGVTTTEKAEAVTSPVARDEAKPLTPAELAAGKRLDDYQNVAAATNLTQGQKLVFAGTVVEATQRLDTATGAPLLHDEAGHQPTPAEVEEMHTEAPPAAERPVDGQAVLLAHYIDEYRKADDEVKPALFEGFVRKALTAERRNQKQAAEMKLLRDMVAASEEQLNSTEQALAKAKNPASMLLFIDSDGSQRSNDVDEKDAPENDGDEWPELIMEGGRRRYRVWLCAAIYTYNATTVYLMCPPGHAITAAPVPGGAVKEGEAA